MEGTTFSGRPGEILTSLPREAKLKKKKDLDLGVSELQFGEHRKASCLGGGKPGGFMRKKEGGDYMIYVKKSREEKAC